MQRVYTLLAIADGNNSFVLAQAIVVLPTCLKAVRVGWADRNMYLPGSLKMQEHMRSRTAPVKVSKLPPFSSSIGQLTSVFSCPAGMSTIWMAEMVPSLPPILTLRLSPILFVSSLLLSRTVASHLSRRTMPAPLARRKTACFSRNR